MNKKQEFLDIWNKEVGSMAMKPEDYYKKKLFKEFAYCLNNFPDVRRAFNEAWDEAVDTESDPAVGLSSLFPEE